MVDNDQSGGSRSKNNDDRDRREFGESGNAGAGGGAASDQPKLTDAVKKILTAGVSAAFMTEESVRSYLAEVKLPKEIMGLLLQGASKTKDEVAQRVSSEMISLLKKIDFAKEFAKFAEEHKFKITAEIEIAPKKNKEK